MAPTKSQQTTHSDVRGLTHQARLTLNVFSNMSFHPCSPLQCLLRIQHWKVSRVPSPCNVGLCECVCLPAGSEIGSGHSREIPIACCSLSCPELTVIRHVGYLEPSGTVAFIGLELNPQLLGPGGEGDRALVGLAGLIGSHGIGGGCKGRWRV